MGPLKYWLITTVIYDGLFCIHDLHVEVNLLNKQGKVQSKTFK